VGRGLLSYNIKTGLRNQLETQFGVSPTAFPQLNWIVGSDVMWTPIYGKTSWLNSSVGHFEVFGTPGRLGGQRAHRRGRGQRIGQTVFRPAIHLGLGARLFTSKSVVLPARLQQRVRHLQGARGQHPPRPARAALNFGGTE
jgi:hypothetical protein